MIHPRTVRIPWWQFVLKAAVLVALIVVSGMGFASRFRIGFDPQNRSCIPEFSVYLLDLHDTKLVRGNLYAFSAARMEPVWRDGTRMVKYLHGMPGDYVEIDRYQRIWVNGENVATGLYLAHQLQRTPSDFMGKGRLKSDEYWFFGTAARSFDSRYSGAVAPEQVIGRVYPIF